MHIFTLLYAASFFLLTAMRVVNAQEGQTDSISSYRIITAGYTSGIHSLTFEAPNTLRREHSLNDTGSPSWVTFQSDIAYVISEEGPVGKVYTVLIGKPNSRLQVIGSQKGYKTNGSSPVASCVVGQCLYVANYMSGSASVLQLSNRIPNTENPIKTFQFTRKGTGPVSSRQDHSYAHDAVASPDGGWVYIPDLGADEIHHIQVGTDCSQASNTSSTKVSEGSGPRHIAFYKDSKTGKQYAYLASELSTTLTAFLHDANTGSLTAIGEPVLSVPEGTSLGGNQTAGPQITSAEVVVSHDGRFVYVSVRGDKKEDHIALFQRDTRSGQITFQEWTPSGGRLPRHISQSFDGKYLAVAHQTTNNVVVFSRDSESGQLIPTGAEVRNLDKVAFAGFVPV